jgi:SAM-dependent methyltransferase
MPLRPIHAPVERLSTIVWAPPWVRHQHVARYEWAAGLAAGQTVVDAACGTGYGARALLAGGAARVDGFDLSPEAIAEARRLHGACGARFEVADVAGLPVPDGAYDLYLSFETIEHVEGPGALVREAVRVLKPGGTFICSTPNRTVTNPGLPSTGRSYNPFHLREYTRPELEALLREVFTSVTFLGQSFRGAGYVRALSRVGRLWPLLAVRAHQARKVLEAPWDKQQRHWPTPLPAKKEPEVLVAVCGQPDRG